MNDAHPVVEDFANPTANAANRGIRVALLTGGSDRPYVWGLTTELLSKGVIVDLIGSDELDWPEFRDKRELNFLNLRGDQRPDASWLRKILRVTAYYGRLVRYAATAKPKLFHILWNNKFETFDRTLLMLYYVALGKKIALTAHNVNEAQRDGNDSLLNRLTLTTQYHLANQIFVHTAKMKSELARQFGVREARITVIPFGINNAVPNSNLTPIEARQMLGIQTGERVILFFGRITPYKGLEYLIDAFHRIPFSGHRYRLIIAGRVDAAAGEEYWNSIRGAICKDEEEGRALVKTEFIPDEQAEVYFKAGDVLILPYRQIYQSGVLFLAHSFGLPVLAADVGSLRDEIVEGTTGFVFRPEDSADLAKVIERYFKSDLFTNLSSRRDEIRHYATQRNSWDAVGKITMSVYRDLVRGTVRGLSDENASRASVSQ